MNNLLLEPETKLLNNKQKTTMNKNIFTILLVALVSFSFTSCGESENNIEEGVVINNVRWATRNVASFGFFTNNPQDVGQFRQWNRRGGWGDGSILTSWNPSTPTGNAWTRENDPCPRGWRVPTQAELQSLGLGTWVADWNGTRVSGRVFGTAPYQIFLPAAGYLRANDGEHEERNLYGYYWSSTASGTNNAVALVFNDLGRSVTSGNSRSFGFSVRCVAID